MLPPHRTSPPHWGFKDPLPPRTRTPPPSPVASYRWPRYHLNEFDGHQPETPEEYFNMKHSRARNVIERCFDPQESIEDDEENEDEESDEDDEVLDRGGKLGLN
ncbi:hypothetical protein ZIOFF_037711 [Zingiber officinale]|uniref:Uncharacterized protein n=1 Tax=Zingiber officinale TaxID=94328 RepID=A0A8J5GGD3_ZINOF|nr:hypothetical protein ZIOFF_037711 [Zingiber officinale]